MEIVLSGLDENACRELVGDTLWNHDSVVWMPPEHFLDPVAWQAGMASGKRAVWFYHSPVEVVSRIDIRSTKQDSETVLNIWLRQNRAALNLRRQRDCKLLMVNADRVSIAKLRAELGDVPHGDNIPETASADVASELTALVAHVLEWAGPRYFEVFRALEAACWLPSDDPDLPMESIQGEAPLVGMLKMLDQGAALQMENDRLHTEGSKLQKRLHHANEELENQVKREQVANLNKTQETQQQDLDAGRENELLLTQIHQLQEELEAYYLRNAELSSQLSDATKHASADEDATRALKAQLQQMHKELQRMAQAHADTQEAGASKSRVSRFLPSKLRKRREHAQAEKLLQSRLDVVGQSEWFDRKWYLETYPDVKAAGMDPVRHYVEFGWKEGRNPGSGFDTSYYLMSNVDVARGGLNPLLHFIEHGREEGRIPCEP